ncbi:MAG: phosphotransferase [Chloroflexota bacterium]|nr:phosphotransferase [Chloroflexota bacterium]
MQPEGSSARTSADASVLRDVLARYGIVASTITPIPAGRMNRHWRVEAADGAVYALRRYTPERSPAAIAFEHGVIEDISRRGWPVAAPLGSDDGATFVSIGGQRYALFPFLGGQPGPPYSAAHLRTKGRLLARLHRDLASSPARDQREGWGRIWESDVTAPIGRFASFNDALLAFGGEHPDLASAIRRYRYRSLRELARLGYGDLPDTLIHFDFHNDNLLFDGGVLSALLDFDSVHFDARAADIACSVANDCPEPPADIATSADAAAAFVGGYVAHTPLEDRELRLIVPLLRAYRLSGLPRTMRAWSDGRHDEVFPRLKRLLEQRLPALDTNGAQIEAAVMRAAHAVRHH